MILYHFTPLEYVEAIQRDGLRALLQGSHDSSTILGTCDKPAVYLTDIPTTKTPFPPPPISPHVSSRPADGTVHIPPAVA